MSFTSCEELREYVIGDQSKGRIKFSVKVLHVLKHCLENPHLVPKLGVSWCPDGTSFVCNSKIIGSFLNLRSNSINTNFRAHGFQIIETPVTDVISWFGNLPDINNWKRRKNVLFKWTTQTTPEEADNVRSQEKKSLELFVIPGVQTSIASNSTPSIPKPISAPLGFLPSILSDLLKNDTGQLISIASIAHSINYTDDQRRSVLNDITKEWIKLFGTECFAPYSDVVDSFLLYAPKLSDDYYFKLKSNIMYLLKNQPMMSQISDGLSFRDYLALLFRYGPHQNVAASLLEFTDFSSVNTFNDYFMSIPENCEYRPHFKIWFNPLLDRRNTQLLLNSQCCESWIVRHASNYDSFSVHARMYLNENYETVSSHIKYNFSSPLDKRFSVEMRPKEVHYASTIEQILFNSLGLKVDNALRYDVSSNSGDTKHVDADVIANRPQPPPHAGFSLDFSTDFGDF